MSYTQVEEVSQGVADLLATWLQPELRRALAQLVWRRLARDWDQARGRCNIFSGCKYFLFAGDRGPGPGAGGRGGAGGGAHHRAGLHPVQAARGQQQVLSHIISLKTLH